MTDSIPRWLLVFIVIVVFTLVWGILAKVTGRTNPFSSGLILPCGDAVQGDPGTLEQLKARARAGDYPWVLCTHGHYFQFKDDHWIGPINGMSQAVYPGHGAPARK